MAKRKGLWIEEDHRTIEGIDLITAGILSVISSYENRDMPCYVTNSQLGERLLASDKQIKDRIRSLSKSGIIRIENPGKPSRELYIKDLSKRYIKDRLQPKQVVPFRKEVVPFVKKEVHKEPVSSPLGPPINKDNKEVIKEVINTPTELAQAPSLHKAIELAFLSKCGSFTDYPREGRSIKGLIKKAEARSPDDPELFINQLITAFYDMRQTDKFFKKQPFTPTTLNSLGIFDRVMVQFEESHKELDPEIQAYYAERMGI